MPASRTNHQDFLPTSFPVKTRAGIFTLQLTKKGLYGLKFPPARVRREPGSAGKTVRLAGKMLRDYFAGVPVDFSRLKFDWTGLSPFESKVLRVLLRVPYGVRISYGELARRAGNPGAARAVGHVMRRNRLPIFLPCHRVIQSSGKLGGYGPGLKWKRFLLTLESK